MHTTIHCLYCDGSGGDPYTDIDFVEEFGHLWECPECEGLGYIWVEEDDPLPET